MIPLTYSESLRNAGYGRLSNHHKIEVVELGLHMMLKFYMGCFLHIPKLYSEYRKNLKGSALFCVDLIWNGNAHV